MSSPVHSPAPLAFLDIETTGTDLEGDRIYEIAIILSVPGKALTVYHVSLPVSEKDFRDDIPLRMYKDHKPRLPRPSIPADVAARISQLTAGAVLVGNNPHFDAQRLERFLLDNGQTPRWHYQLDDVEARAAQKLDAGPPPWNSTDLSSKLGIDRSAFDSHSAIGDARWSLCQYEVLVGKDLGSSTLGKLGLAPSRVVE